MRHFIFWIWIFASTTVFSQSVEVQDKSDNIYYLLGTLDDYMGRAYWKSIEDQVDKYYPHESGLSQRLKELFKNDYPDINIVVENSGHQKLTSKRLAQQVNSFFHFAPSNQKILNENDQWEEMRNGKLKDSIFRTDIQKYNYIAGVLARYGQKTNDGYKIVLANSVNKARLCESMLKSLNCTDIRYDIREAIPCSHIITFTPTGEMKKYLGKTAPEMLAKPD